MFCELAVSKPRCLGDRGYRSDWGRQGAGQRSSLGSAEKSIKPVFRALDEARGLRILVMARFYCNAAL